MVEKITLMEAYQIEHLRQEGITDNEIKEAVLALQADRFKKLHDSFDFTMLHALSNRITSILQEGYEVKFLTFNGLVNLLRIKFHKEKDVDYVVDHFVVSKLEMGDSTYATLQQLVSANWTVTKEANKVTIAPTK